MNSDWIKVFTSANAMKAEMVKQVLIENNIEAVILNKQGYPYNIGEVEVYVQPARVEEAKEVLDNSDI